MQTPSTTPETWRHEILARHRWGQHGGRAADELSRLNMLWEAAQPLDPRSTEIIEQITALEICNWDLEDSILALCEAIGAMKSANRPIGHLASVGDQRWLQVWAYYASLRDWLPTQGRSGYQSLLRAVDPDRTTRAHVLGMLGERDQLRELYVERFCLCLENWLGGYHFPDSVQAKAHSAAVAAVEDEIRVLDPEGQILGAMEGEGDGRLQPCHHKAFRRYDIIISSIGVGAWRAVMPAVGTDGFGRAVAVEKFLAPIEMWIGAQGKPPPEGSPLAARIFGLLGAPDSAKLFLAALLASLLRAQQLAAKQRAERAMQSS